MPIDEDVRRVDRAVEDMLFVRRCNRIEKVFDGAGGFGDTELAALGFEEPIERDKPVMVACVGCDDTELSVIVVGYGFNFEQVRMIEGAHLDECVEQVSAEFGVVDPVEAVEEVVCVGAIAEDDESCCTMSATECSDEFVWAKVFVSERCAHALSLICIAYPMFDSARDCRIRNRLVGLRLCAWTVSS